MKVLHIVPTYLPAHRYGGPIFSVHALNKALVKAGIEVTVYTTNIDGPENLDVPLGVPVDIDGVKVFYFPATVRSWFYSYAMQQVLKMHVREYDLVHITSVFLAASTLGAYYARKFEKPYIISPRGSLMREPLRYHKFKKRAYISLLEERNLHNAAAIHFTDTLEEKEYREADFPLRHGFVIPNSLDVAPLNESVVRGIFRKRFGLGADKEVVLFLSRINWKKGFDTLIPAFARLVKERPNAVLVIAGGDDEEYKQKVEEMIAKEHIGTAVLFTGPLHGKEKLEAYHDAQCFVLPSYSENFGMAVAEAMYMRLPVIVTKGVALQTYVQKSNAGIVIEKNEQELFHAMRSILSDRKKAEEMGARGRRIIEEEFSLPKIAERFIKEYKGILSR